MRRQILGICFLAFLGVGLSLGFFSEEEKVARWGVRAGTEVLAPDLLAKYKATLDGLWYLVPKENITKDPSCKIKVGAIYGLCLSSQTETLNIRPGQVCFFPHQITNRSNLTIRVKIEAKGNQSGLQVMIFQLDKETLITEPVMIGYGEVYRFYIGATFKDEKAMLSRSYVEVRVSIVDEKGDLLADGPTYQGNNQKEYGGIDEEMLGREAVPEIITLKGRVYDEKTKKPLSRVRVECYVKKNQSVVKDLKTSIEDANEGYCFPYQPVDCWFLLKVMAKGYAPKEVEIFPKKEEYPVVVRDVYLSPVVVAEETVVGPNPATGGKLTFYYYLPSSGTVEIKVYNIACELVTVLKEWKPGGRSEGTEWQIDDVAQGVYIYKITAELDNQQKIDFPPDKLAIIKQGR